VNVAQLLHYGMVWKVIQNQSLYFYLKDTASFLKIELDRMA